MTVPANNSMQLTARRAAADAERLGPPMFCPQCHCEYREGFLRCADCDVALVAQLPNDDRSEAQETLNDEEHFIPFPIDDAAKLATVRSLLESGEIPFQVAGEFSSKTTPTLLVPESYASEVEAILAAYRSTR